MVRTSEYVKLRFLSFYRRNVKICQAVRELNLEGIKVTKKTVSFVERSKLRVWTQSKIDRTFELSVLTLKTSYSARKLDNQLGCYRKLLSVTNKRQ